MHFNHQRNCLENSDVMCTFNVSTIYLVRKQKKKCHTPKSVIFLKSWALTKLTIKL